MLSLRHPPRSLAALKADLRRVALGIAYSLRPRRLAVLPHLAVATLLPRNDEKTFTHAARGLVPGRQGLVGMVGSLDPESLMRGFRLGLFPFSHVGRKKWWLHPQRMVIAPHLIKQDKDVRRLLKNRKFTITFDQRFEDVTRACAEPRKGHVPLTWITEDIVEAYGALHRAGHAHSFEAWGPDGELAGGGFGIAVGPVFVIESQFTRQRNASKAAMVTLLRHLSAWGFELADGKAHTDYLEDIGFGLIPHQQYLATIRRGPEQLGAVGAWAVDPALDPSVDWGPAYAADAPPERQDGQAA